MFARFIAGDTSRVPTQLRAVFSEHGWTVSDALIVGEADPAPSGIALHISAVPDHLPLSLVVKEALEAADISFALYKRDEQSADQNPKICFTQAT